MRRQKRWCCTTVQGERRASVQEEGVAGCRVLKGWQETKEEVDECGAVELRACQKGMREDIGRGRVRYRMGSRGPC